MALQNIVQHERLNLPAAYIKANFGGYDMYGCLVAVVQTYPTQELRTLNLGVLETKTYLVNDTGGEPLDVIYEHLKTLPEFAGALDV